MNTLETRTRTTSTHPAVDATFVAAARLAREATSRHTAPQACRAIIDALSTPALGFAGMAIVLDRSPGYSLFQVSAGTWPPLADVEPSLILTVPLLLDDARIGELTVYKSEGVFEEPEAALITAAAAHASLGVARARLIQELELLRSEAADTPKKNPPGKRSTAGSRRRSGKKTSSTVRKSRATGSRSSRKR